MSSSATASPRRWGRPAGIVALVKIAVVSLHTGASVPSTRLGAAVRRCAPRGAVTKATVFFDHDDNCARSPSIRPITDLARNTSGVSSETLRNSSVMLLACAASCVMTSRRSAGNELAKRLSVCWARTSSNILAVFVMAFTVFCDRTALRAVSAAPAITRGVNTTDAVSLITSSSSCTSSNTTTSCSGRNSRSCCRSRP